VRDTPAIFVGCAALLLILEVHFAGSVIFRFLAQASLCFVTAKRFPLLNFEDKKNDCKGNGMTLRHDWKNPKLGI